jgi:hypothetical protein
MNLLKDTSYLKTGTKIQQAAYKSLESLDLFNFLKKYSPILAGTIPLGIDVEGSDLDIICEAENLPEFEDLLINKFQNQDEFKSYLTKVRGVDSVVVQFYAEGFHFEIFAQNAKSCEQYAVVHMVIEKRLLDILGPSGVKDIKNLKTKGLKTEPAFCKCLGINGDPYEALYELRLLTNEELLDFVKNSKLKFFKKG